MPTFKFTNPDNSIIEKRYDDGRTYNVHISSTALWDELVAEANGVIQAAEIPDEPPAYPTTEQKIALAGFDEGELEDYLVEKIRTRLIE